MNDRSRRAILGSALLLVAGCASGPPLVKDRYAEAEYRAPTGPSPVRVSAVALERPAEAGGVALTALSAEAQAEMVKAHAGKPPLRLKSASSQPLIEPFTPIERRVVIALRRTDFARPGERLSAVRLEIAPRGPWRIVSWNRLATDLGTVTVGTVEQTDETKLTASTGLNIGGPLSDTSVDVEQSRKLVETMGVTDDIVQTASITPEGSAWIDIRGAWGKDLALNIVLDLDIGLPPDQQVEDAVFDFGALFADGEPVAGKTVKVGTRWVARPKDQASTVPVHADIFFEGQQRQIVAGERTFTEADDKVAFVVVRDCTALVLAPPQAQESWGLGFGQLQLVYRPKDATLTDIVRLAGWPEALELARWLRQSGPKAAQLHRATLELRDPDDAPGKSRPITDADIARLQPMDLAAEQTAQTVKAATGVELKNCPADRRG